LGWGETGFQLFDDWSKTSHKYDPHAARALWENLNQRAHGDLETRITWATIVMLAEEAGWTAAEGWAAKEAAEKADKVQAASDAFDKLKAAGNLDALAIEAIEAGLQAQGLTPFDGQTIAMPSQPPIIIPTEPFCWRELSTVAPRPVLGADGLFLQQQEVARQQQELARLYRCKAHPSFACP